MVETRMMGKLTNKRQMGWQLQQPIFNHLVKITRQIRQNLQRQVPQWFIRLLQKLPRIRLGKRNTQELPDGLQLPALFL